MVRGRGIGMVWRCLGEVPGLHCGAQAAAALVWSPEIRCAQARGRLKL